VVGVGFVLLGAFALGVRIPGIEGVVAPIAVIGGWSLIGFLAGYGVKRRGPDAEVFESAFRGVPRSWPCAAPTTATLRSTR
jgi:hypothetical protein